MGYRYYNPNPSGRMVGDCVIRAISKATNRSWEEIYVKVAIQGLMMHDMPSSNSVWGSFLYNQNFHRYSIPDMCPDCYTVAEAFFNVTSTAIIDVPRGCCLNLSVENVPADPTAVTTPAINVQNSNLTVSRIA